MTNNFTLRFNEFLKSPNLYLQSCRIHQLLRLSANDKNASAIGIVPYEPRSKGHRKNNKIQTKKQIIVTQGKSTSLSITLSGPVVHYGA